MALIRGIHCLAHGNKSEARRIADDIQQHQRLLVGHNTWHGAGAYAYYADRLPDNLSDWPQVLFEVDNTQIRRCTTPRGSGLDFFRIPGSIGDYVPIHVLAFLHVWDDEEVAEHGTIHTN